MGEAGTWDPAVTTAAGRCGSGSGLWRAGGGCVEPVAQPTGCGAPTPSLLSTDTARGEVTVQLSRLNENKCQGNTLCVNPLFTY